MLLEKKRLLESADLVTLPWSMTITRPASVKGFARTASFDWKRGHSP